MSFSELNNEVFKTDKLYMNVATQDLRQIIQRVDTLTLAMMRIAHEGSWKNRCCDCSVCDIVDADSGDESLFDYARRVLRGE